MKRDAGWMTAIVAVTATLGLSTFRSSPQPEGAPAARIGLSSSTSTTAQAAEAYKGPCHAIESALQGFFYPYKSLIQPPLAECPLETFEAPKPATPPVTEIAAKGRFVIATLPDPIHTHLSLMFDRQAEAIQQAAQDAGFTYDSSWFPWEKADDAPLLLKDRDIAENRRDDREEHPGILLFRRSVDQLAQSAASPFNDFLIVFVVGEDPTGGIHRHQFQNAVAWISQIKAKQKPEDRSPTQILGPSFSGSLPSLLQVLAANPRLQTNLSGLDIYSGQVTSTAGVKWFKDATTGQKVNFHSFSHDDYTASRGFAAYLRENGLEDDTHVAVVAEDETAYGYSADNDRSAPAFFHFYYPRDISAVRAAYQEQSLFSRTSSADAARRTLRDDLVETESSTHDTIRTYAAKQTALSQEAVLLQIVSMLRAHNTHFILLRSSNPLDQLFLAHFLKMTYPEGRVVTFGNDLLLRREVGAGGLNGIMTLSTYPLIPEIDDWINPPLDNTFPAHSHRAFSQDGAQGVYVALRFLLSEPCPAKRGPCRPTPGSDSFRPLPDTTHIGIPGYATPFWQEKPQMRPLLWLSVLGNKGFAPVAALNTDDRPLKPSSISGIAEFCDLNLSEELCSAPGTLFRSVWSRPTRAFYTVRYSHHLWWPKVPFSMKVALVAVFLWACFHALCCCAPSITVKPEHRSYFVRMCTSFSPPVSGATVTSPPTAGPRSHMVLIVFSSVLLSMAAMTLAWSYGWMSDQGEPIQHPFRYAIFPYLVWLIAASAIIGNAYIERDLSLLYPMHSRRNLLASPRPWSRAARWSLRAARLPLACFTAATVGFYVLFVLYLDSSLPTNLRTLTYFRSMNLTTGVSPAVPILLLILGMYGWAWNSLRGLTLFNAGKPRLPLDVNLRIGVQGKREKISKKFFTMIDEDHAATKMEALSWPFHHQTWAACAILFVSILVLATLISNGIPLRSLGLSHYSLLICAWIAISMSVLLTNAWQMIQLWMRLRNLLMFLDKLPLRRTMQAIRGFSWGSIWGMGGNVLDIRYKLFYRQFETLNHLQASLKRISLGEVRTTMSPQDAQVWFDKLETTRTIRRDFAEWYAASWNTWSERDLSKLQRVQENTAELVGGVLTEILVPEWNAGTVSLLAADSPASSISEGEEPQLSHLAAKLPKHVRAAEEIVCLLYLGFVQNILGRIRTLVLGMTCLFLSIAFVIPSYPFDPRPLLTGAVIFLFLAVAVVIFTVYSQMFRDATLSHLTNTKPGELGGEFWIKLLTFGIGPAVGLLASVFPELSQFVLSFIGPGSGTAK